MQYIPQGPPFEMIDTLVSATDTETVASLTITEDQLFVNQGRFTEPGLIEHMAQTAAAGTGWLAAQKGMPAPVGFIGAVKNLVIQSLPAVGATITCRVRMQHQVQAQVQVGDTTIAEAEFKIFLQENQPA
jgi:3-hydroxyacyl-[acyl-carrier-protein] dehydratase